MRKRFILGGLGSVVGAIVVTVAACNGPIDLDSARRRPDAGTQLDGGFGSGSGCTLDGGCGGGSGTLDAGNGGGSGCDLDGGCGGGTLDAGPFPSDGGSYPSDGHHHRW